MVRVPTNQTGHYQTDASDIGFYSFLIPFVETQKAARQMYSTRYPPERHSRRLRFSPREYVFGTVPDYFAQSNKTSPLLLFKSKASWCRQC